MSQGKSSGVFYVEGRPEDDPLQAKDLELFRVLCSQIAVAVENADLYLRMKDSYQATVEALAMAIDAKDKYTSGHSQAVTEYMVPVAIEVGIPQSDMESLYYAAILHDVGKIAVSERVLNKPGKLTNEEFDAIKKHPVVGADIVKSISFLQPAVEMIRHHHERWDGRGYPDGLKGDEIPIGAQIVGIVDTFDAMTSKRAYRKAMSVEDAIAEIKRCTGTQFNPKVVEAFMTAFESGLLIPPEERKKYQYTDEESFRGEGAM